MSPPLLLAQALERSFGLLVHPHWHAELLRVWEDLRRRRGWPVEAVADVARDREVLLELASGIVVGETFFLRHPEQFDLLCSHVARRLAACGSAAVWSAGCASGEEPYSMAIAFDRGLGEDAGRVVILASDICSTALERARRGEYGAWSFRGVPASVWDHYFRSPSAGRWELLPHLRERVQFEAADLESALAGRAAASLDAVFFRNVGIYLSPFALERIFAGLRRVLHEDGLLMVAPSDPRPPVSLFETTGSCVGVFRVRRQEDAGCVPAPRRGVHSASPAPSHSRPVDRRRPAAPASRPPAVQPPGAAPRPEHGPLELAVAHLAADRVGDALEDLRRLLYLDPQHRIGRFWLASALAAAGQTKRSLAQVRELERSLEACPPAEPLEDAETTAGELLGAVRSLRASF